MKYLLRTILFIILLAATGCSSGRSPFNGYTKEVFPVTRITESYTKTIQILNESTTEVQHVLGIAFYANSNKKGHFQLTEVRVGTEKVGNKDIFIPPMGVLNLIITYAPLNLETSEASFGGWITTSEDKEIIDIEVEVKKKPETSKDALSVMKAMMKYEDSEEEGDAESDDDQSEDSEENKESDDDTIVDLNEAVEGETIIEEYESAIHRTILMIAFDKPRQGYNQIELIGGAISGPDGEEETVSIGGGGGECVAEGTTACFRGMFYIDLPGLMSGGGLEVPMNGPVPFKIEGGAAELNMDEFPPVLIALVGNGPGEPLEGKPVDAISIIISGTSETAAAGSFDGRNLSLSNTSFRVRVLLGEITYEDINPGLAAAVDFNISDLEIVTEEAFDGSKIVFGFETTLSATPSNNGLFDSFLGNARVIVKFTGMLELP